MTGDTQRFCHGARIRRWAVLSVAVLAAVFAADAARAASPTVVSLTFDDSRANHITNVRPALNARGLKGTFYVISGEIGNSGSLTFSDLRALAADGHEIGGHTVLHSNLVYNDPDETRREICNDRAWLLNNGFAATSFAYPFGSFNSTTQQIVQECGYNSARTTVGVKSDPSCVFQVPTNCAESIPPANPYATRTPLTITSSMTVADVQKMVTTAEDNGGGWIQLIFHDVCECAGPYNFTPAKFNELLDWLVARQAQGTVVKTVHEVVGGDVKPAVTGPAASGPAPAGANMLRNASLEQDGPTENLFAAYCWRKFGNGATPATWTRVSDAHNGSVAVKVDIASIESWGYHALIPTRDLGACAPAAKPGTVYRFKGWYKASAPLRVISYYRTTDSKWKWYEISGQLPAATDWTQATYTFQPLPADATAISVGFYLNQAGSFTIDDFTLFETETTPPDTTITSAPSSPTASTSPRFTFSANETATFECSLDGAAFAACSSPADYTGLAAGTHRFDVRATDLSGNVDATPASHSWTIDTTAPETTITSGPPGSTFQTSASFAFSASETSAFSCSIDGSVFEACTSPKTYSGLTVGTHTFQVRATDVAGNTDATPAGRSWTISISTPYTDAVRADIPTGWWRLGESSGTTAFDSSGNNRHGTYVNGATLGVGGAVPSDTAAAFNGSTQYGSIPYNSAYNASRFTAEAWAMVKGGSGTYRAVASSRDWASGKNYGWVLYASTSNTWEFWIASGGKWQSVGGPTIVNDRWTHLVGTYDGSTARLYVNGSLVASRSIWSFGANTRQPLRVGAGDSGNPKYFFPGVVDEVATYNKVLPSDRVQAHYGAASSAPTGTAPETTITSAPPAAARSTSATFEFSADVPSTFQCSLDGAAFSTCTSPQAYNGLAEGAHRFDVRAIDAKGNPDPTPARHTWTVDMTPPDTSITAGPSGSVTTGSATFGFTATETATFVCSLDGAAAEACTSPKNYSGLAPGQHTFEVRATDAAGNADSTPATRTWTITATNAYTDAILADGPAAYWRLGEPSGTVAYDTSSNGRDGSYVNGPTLGSPGAVPGDTAVTLNGAGQHASAPYNAALNADAFTVEAWANVTGGAGTWRAVASSRDWFNSAHYGYVLYASTSNTWQFWVASGGTWQILSGGPIATGQWTHLVASFDGTTMRIYVNGTLVGSKTILSFGPNTRQRLLIGAGGFGTPEYFFPGSIVELVVYPDALAAHRVLDHYSATRR